MHTGGMKAKRNYVRKEMSDAALSKQLSGKEELRDLKAPDEERRGARCNGFSNQAESLGKGLPIGSSCKPPFSRIALRRWKRMCVAAASPC